MVDKKTIKAKSANIKKANEVKTIEQLRSDLATKITDLQQAKRGNAAGELMNPRVITVTRKEIARLNFAIRANEIAEAKS